MTSAIQLQSDYQRALRDWQDQADRRRRESAECLPTILTLLSALEGMPVTSLGYIDSGPYISIKGSKAILGRMFYILRTHGWAPKSRPKAGEVEFNTHWCNADGVELFIMFGSTSCQRVQVGTETITRPVYETRCSDADEQLTARDAALIAEIPF